jgi:RNA polymerase sigma-70 factor (ECF subfamily)
MDWNRICDRTVEDINASLEKQWQHQMFARAVVSIKSHVQPDTWQAFWRASIDLVSPEEVAKELGTTVGNVYVARSRVIAKLRTWVHQNADLSIGERP